MDIPVEAQIFQPAPVANDESIATVFATDSRTEEQIFQTLATEPENPPTPELPSTPAALTTTPAMPTTHKWSSAIGQARPVGQSPRGLSSDALVNGPPLPSRDVRNCYGPEYAVGFAFLLTFFCLLLGAFTLRLCCPMIRDAAEKHCGLTFTWARHVDSRSSSSSSSSSDGVYSTISATKLTAVAVDPYVGGVYFGK